MTLIRRRLRRRRRTRKRAYHRRVFLNEKSGMAAVEATVSHDSGGYVEANLTLSDCNRQVNLDFCGGPDSAPRMLRKLRRLLQIVREMEAVMAPMVEGEVEEEPDA